MICEVEQINKNLRYKVLKIDGKYYTKEVRSIKQGLNIKLWHIQRLKIKSSYKVNKVSVFSF